MAKKPVHHAGHTGFDDLASPALIEAVQAAIDAAQDEVLKNPPTPLTKEQAAQAAISVLAQMVLQISHRRPDIGAAFAMEAFGMAIGATLSQASDGLFLQTMGVVNHKMMVGRSLVRSAGDQG